MAAMLALAAWKVDFHGMMAAMAGAHASWLAPILAVLVVGQLLRALRWWLLVRPIKAVTPARLAPIAFAGFMAINLFPLRAGEAARPLLLRSREDVPIAAGLGTVLAERVADVISLLLLFIVSLALLPVDAEIAGKSVRAIARILLALCVAGVLFLAALMVLRERLVRAVEKVVAVVSPKAAAIVARLLGVFVEGLAAFRTPALAAEVAALSVSIWGLQAIAMGMGIRMFDLGAPVSAALPVLAITMAGITIPAGIGMSGNFQAACVLALHDLYGIPHDPAFAYAVVLNLACFVVAVGMGLLAMPFLGVKWSALTAPQENAA